MACSEHYEKLPGVGGSRGRGKGRRYAGGVSTTPRSGRNGGYTMMGGQTARGGPSASPMTGSNARRVPNYPKSMMGDPRG
jgi:hypothetical protein